MSTPVPSPSVAGGNAGSASSAVGVRRVQSFQSLSVQWAPEIAATARALATPWCPASDLEQAGLIALWNAARMFRASQGFFDHYYRRSMKRAMLRERERSAPLTVARPDVVPLFDDEVEEIGYETRPFDDGKVVSDWVRRLPTRLRQVFDLVYRQGFTQVEAGAIMGISQGRVSQLHAQLLARGRVELAELAA